ncbi:MAG TPA: TetR/AcrR family transcriptional regulator [Caulobacteraceae bacterium]|jgi:TetR/AcrR family transcriptional repressor of nem operon
MKRSKAETAETHQRIVESAAGEFRRNGIHATGIANVMATAGLSHGGFYRHFDSKDELVTEACAESIKALVDSTEAATCERRGKDGLREIVQAYLSAQYGDDVAGSCPFVGVGSEMARAGPQTRAAASEGLREWIDAVAKRIGPEASEAARAQAVFTICAMVGAVTLARIVDDPALSASILEHAKDRLLEG